MSKRVPEGWSRSTLGKVAKLTMGQSPSSDTYNTENNGLPFFQGNADFGSRYPRVRYWCNEPTKIANEQSILFSVRAPVGEVNIAPYECCIGRGLAAIDGEKVHQEFLYQKLQHAKPQFQLLSQGSTFEAVNGSDLKEFDLVLPPVPEQQKIAAILFSVDDVIEKTRAQIDKLKDLKTGMMQELLTKGIGHTEFKDSPVGQIPVGWKCKTIGQLADFVTSGSRGWAQYYSEAGSIFIRIGNLTREHINLRFNDIVYVSPPESAEGRRTRVQLGDILISITADLGVIGVVNESIGEAYVNQHISLVRLIDPTIARWIGHFLMFEDTQKQFVESNDAGAKAGLNLSAIRNIVVAIPKQQERDKIVVILDKIDEDVVLKRSRLDRLISIKQALMQDLLTGKVRVNVD
ncbi:restriction endonuclease subunit S [uncultured Paenalcaligenes sp.]|uniref:restriction endonuclease subunit S n=1 Tax=uncultured Paenalcaligenes sp. TaxID=1588925 RepID=UPI002605E623|nr:restriction endonuclease subunit S [uncultured Paenalcaligenes sp.]